MFSVYAQYSAAHLVLSSSSNGLISGPLHMRKSPEKALEIGNNRYRFSWFHWQDQTSLYKRHQYCRHSSLKRWHNTQTVRSGSSAPQTSGIAKLLTQTAAVCDKCKIELPSGVRYWCHFSCGHHNSEQKASDWRSQERRFGGLVASWATEAPGKYHIARTMLAHVSGLLR